VNAREAIEPEQLDQGADLGLGAAHTDRPAVRPQPPSQEGEVEHQRGVGEYQLGEIDDDVGLRADRTRQRGTPKSLGIAVLIAAAAEGRRLVVEVNDPRNLLNERGA
jgi:hypothetical protein